MSDVNLIKDKIREELEKGLPSKRKILSYLLDLLKKNKYPSLSDFDFYDIVGYTYKLNLNYKLNLEIFFYPIYNELKKKIKKLYGKEKRLEMEQYLIKNYDLFNAEHIFNRILNKIKKEYEQAPSKDLSRMLDLKLKILDIYSDLLSKEEYQHLSDSDFNFIVRETFKLNPDFFMDSLYGVLRQRMEKKNIDFNFFVGETFKLNPEFFMDSLYGVLRQRMEKKNRLEMDKYVIENYSLIEGEHIIYECNGNIKFVDSQNVKPSGGIKFGGGPPALVKVTSGTIFLTNYRLIAQGMLAAKGWRHKSLVIDGIIGLVLLPSGGSQSSKALKTILESSPTYGFQFPIRNHMYLKKKWNGVSYKCIQDNQLKILHIKLTSKTSQAKREEQINAIFKILSKDVNHIKDTIKVILERKLKDRLKKREIIALLKDLRVSEEYQDISDSEYLDIVRETYKLDPQFFMDFIYPKMKSWDFPSFLSIIEEFLELIENLNKETE